MIEALHMGMTILHDHIGGQFLYEEKEFMIQTALLEHKWKKGKGVQPSIRIQNGVEATSTVKHRISFSGPEEPTVGFTNARLNP